MPRRTIKLNELVVKPERFEGRKEGARRWIEDYEDASSANGWSEEIMVKYISTFFSKTARDWYSTMVLPSVTSETQWSEIRAKFIRHYVGPQEAEALREEIRLTRQRPAESIIEFMPRMLRLLDLADPNMSEERKLSEVKAKLTDRYRRNLIGQKPTTLEDLNDLCLEIESVTLRSEPSTSGHNSQQG